MSKKTREVFGAVTRKKGTEQQKTFWTRIGTAFENADGSENVVLDYVPADLSNTTIQIRDKKPKAEGNAE